MPKYEAVIDLTVELDAPDSDTADAIFNGEFTDIVLELANSAYRANTYKIWLDIRQIEELEETN